MNRDQARNLIESTFTRAFDKTNFRTFAINVLNRIDETKAGQMIVPDAFKPHVRSCLRLGTYRSPQGELADILIVHTTEDYKIERARTGLRDFVAHKLKREENYKEAGLVAFVSPDSRRWRFSYIRMDYESKRDPRTGKIIPEEHLTPARRFSYLVGEGESSHTAQSRFLTLLQDTETDPTLGDIEEAFSVEAVTREFFTKYAELFEQINKALTKLVEKEKAIRDEFKSKDVNTVDFAKKLMGQIVFLYFLQKKGWLGVKKDKEWGTGPRDFLRRLCSGEYGKYDIFFNDILEPLFYDTLATDRGHEAWDGRFKCRIPFLNGGLFEPLADYDWRRTDIILANKFFTNNDFIEEGVIGTGVLDVFDRYNFTVNEAEPLEKEVAIDPEMLGKVFENLIEENRRKGLGAFYTPREIVHYKCQECLICYLDTALNKDKEIVPRADIETFIYLGEQISHYEAVNAKYPIKMPATIVKHARLIDEKLAAITVCDPAVGSGAYPVGMMTEIVRARCALTRYFNDVHERTPYHFKRYAIQNCLYGVDIDAGAVEIAKLRLWLSLVVDEEETNQIKPLPNLDYKIVVGNSLLGVEKTLFNEQLFRQLETLKPLYFDEGHRDKKAAYKQEIDELIHQLTSGKKTFDFEIYFSEVFHNKGGFDIVIGNPPYLRIQGLQETQPELVPVYKRKFKSASGNFDLYGLFIERGFGLLKADGNFAFIVPHKFFQATFGKGLRGLLNEQRALRQVVRFGAEQVFDEPTTYTCLLFLSRQRMDSFDLFEITDLSDSARVFTRIRTRQEDESYQHCQLPTPTTDDWDFHASGGNIILERLRQQSVTLGDITRKIFVGLQTSSDKIYVLKILKNKRDTVVCHSKILDREVEIERGLVKPFLMGKNVHRYQPPRVENVVIFPYLIEDGRAELMSQKFIRDNFPIGWEYLQENKTALSERENGKMRGNDFFAYIYPKNLREFETVKIMTPEIALGCQMSFDSEGSLYHTTKVYSFVFKSGIKDDLKYFLGVMNSKVLWYFIKATGYVLRGGYFTFKTDYLKPFPIPCSLSKNPPTESQQKEIVKLVDRILAAKRRDAEADTTELECEIDRIVYKLYGLTEEEIAIVEGK